MSCTESFSGWGLQTCPQKLVDKNGLGDFNNSLCPLDQFLDSVLINAETYVHYTAVQTLFLIPDIGHEFSSSCAGVLRFTVRTVNCKDGEIRSYLGNSLCKDQ